MDSLKQRICNYVKINQPASVAAIMREMNISRARYYEEAKALRMLGLLYSAPGIGIFAGMDGYQHWLDHGGKEELSRRAIEANAACQQVRGIGHAEDSNHDETEMFMPYNPERNAVVAEFMKSDAHQRLMMLYGRAV